jgi:hypothetical protein
VGALFRAGADCQPVLQMRGRRIPAILQAGPA